MTDLEDRVGSGYEWMSRGELEGFQSDALARSVAQAAKSPYYSAKFRMRHAWLGGNYVIMLTKKEALDQMTVKIELAKGSFDGSIESLRTQRAELQKQLREQVGFTVNVEILERGSLPASDGKATRVIDERE